MIDRVAALFALAVFVGFLAILIDKVRHPDLIVVVLIVIAMALYDFLPVFLGRGKK